MRTRRGWSAPRRGVVTAWRPGWSATRERARASVVTRATILPRREKTSLKPGNGLEHGLPILQTGLAGWRTTLPLTTVLPAVGRPAALPHAARRARASARSTPRV